jgi:hypothetical protein
MFRAVRRANAIVALRCCHLNRQFEDLGGLGAPLHFDVAHLVTSCGPNLASPGDGLLTSLVVLDLVVRSGESLDEFVADMKAFLQVIVKVKVREKRASLPSPPSPLLSMQRKGLKDSGRVVIRYRARKRWRAS